MTTMNRFASILESLKISNPTIFALVQLVFFGVVYMLEVSPSGVMDWLSYNFPNINPTSTVNTIQLALTGLGFGMSSSTTKYLSPEHKKVKAIEAEKEAIRKGN